MTTIGHNKVSDKEIDIEINTKVRTQLTRVEHQEKRVKYMTSNDVKATSLTERDVKVHEVNNDIVEYIKKASRITSDRTIASHVRSDIARGIRHVYLHLGHHGQEHARQFHHK